MGSTTPPLSMTCVGSRMTVWRAALLGVVATACVGTTPQAQPNQGWSAGERLQLQKLRLVEALPPDATNTWADDAAAASLGRTLFFDPGLSPNAVSCATCHDPARHFTDGRALGRGVGETHRHTPGIEGNLRGPWFTWDGRADSLWAQAAGPLETPEEMNSDRVFVVRQVLTQHRTAYESVFGAAPDAAWLAGLPAHGRPDPARPDGDLATAWSALPEADRALVDVHWVNVLKTLGAYERTLLPQVSDFDRYVDALEAGDAKGGGHLDDAQVRGLGLFLREGQCISCHNGPYFTDRAFHNLGLPEPRGTDLGRTVGATLVAASPLNCDSAASDAEACPELTFLNPTFDDFQGAFKTPSLRSVAETAPYMHTGAFDTLEDVLTFYSELPGEPVLGHRELTLQPLGFTGEQKSDLIRFLESLTAPVRPSAFPGR